MVVKKEAAAEVFAEGPAWEDQVFFQEVSAYLFGQSFEIMIFELRMFCFETLSFGSALFIFVPVIIFSDQEFSCRTFST